MRPFRLFAALLGALLLLSACDYPAEFTSPAGSQSAAHDPALIGSWALVGGDAREVAANFLTVAEGGDGLIVTGMAAYQGPDGSGRPEGGFVWLVFEVGAATVGGQTVFNARIAEAVQVEKEADAPLATGPDPPFAAGPERGYWIARARVTTDDRLHLALIWDEEVDLPRETVACGPDCSYERIPATPEEIAALIEAAEPGALFGRTLVFSRVAGITPPQPED